MSMLGPRWQQGHTFVSHGERIRLASTYVLTNTDLNIIFTHPDHQRRGIGQQLLQWGIDKAAELDFELWLNSWKHGRALYEKNGFVTVSHHITKPKTEHPDEAWKAFERELTDMEEWVMWRPKDGPYVEGKSVKPWEAAQ